MIAAKEIPTAGNSKMLENELGVYRVRFYILCAYNYVHRSLNHPNLLSLLGTVSKPYSVILLMNYVNGQTLHNIICSTMRGRIKGADSTINAIPRTTVQ